MSATQFTLFIRCFIRKLVFEPSKWTFYPKSMMISDVSLKIANLWPRYWWISFGWEGLVMPLLLVIDTCGRFGHTRNKLRWGKERKTMKRGMKKTKGRNQRETKKDIFSILRENWTVLSELSRLHPHLNQVFSSLSGHLFYRSKYVTLKKDLFVINLNSPFLALEGNRTKRLILSLNPVLLKDRPFRLFFDTLV